MSVQVRARREAASFLQTYVGAQGELLVDTTNNRVQVHDGATPGGWPAAKLGDVIGRTAVADAAYTALATDRLIAIVSLTAARTVTLPAASAYPTGTVLTVVDESGACSPTITITLVRAGTDTINGAANAVLSLPYGYLALESDGVSHWTIIDQSTAGMAQQAANNVAITGGAINGTAIGAATPAAIAATQGSFSGEVRTYGQPYGLRIVKTNYGVLFQNDDALFTLRATASGSPLGGQNVVGLSMSLATGSITMANGAAITGGSLNAATVGATTPSTVRGTTVTATTSFNLPSYTVATLPAGSAGLMVFASNARKPSEAAGAGTGVTAVYSNGAWRRLSDETAVAA